MRNFARFELELAKFSKSPEKCREINRVVFMAEVWSVGLMDGNMLTAWLIDERQ
ncbi:hypothetical Protein YC6258_02677 [Gynuella sunshinyii YC6258]|uniref:Uncharacterized protein n=1 Tax=Gynuella sunshinyii YC6258 TaxID=1445510 RepID=A0A0C5V5K3_9GAMM|nr:hypothetical Protein YC6258_02677 [Gynuella sunshinyii YC6258]